VQLEFNPELVASYRQIGYENRALANEDFDDDTKDAGELGAGHSVTALYEIVPTSPKATGSIATVRLRYQEPRGSVSRLITANAVDQGTSEYAASPDLQFAAAVAEVGMLLRDSPNKGDATFAEAMKLARIARGSDMDGLRAEFIQLADTARAMKGRKLIAEE
jgi:Ca-activated chloride channel family protein